MKKKALFLEVKKLNPYKKPKINLEKIKIKLLNHYYSDFDINSLLAGCRCGGGAGTCCCGSHINSSCGCCHR